MLIVEIEDYPFLIMWFDGAEILPFSSRNYGEKYVIAIFIPASVKHLVLALSHVLLGFAWNHGNNDSAGEYRPQMLDFAFEIGGEGAFAIAVFDANLGPAYTAKRETATKDTIVRVPLHSFPFDAFPLSGARRAKIVTPECVMNLLARAR